MIMGFAAGIFLGKGSHPCTTPSAITPEGTFIPFHWPVAIPFIEFLAWTLTMLGVAVVWLQFPLSTRLFHGREDGSDGGAKAVLGTYCIANAEGMVRLMAV